ncbi:MAG: YkgJ family cysteine cluster protein [Blautia sp.]|nr:YkgJ family cysteine cluster protein [Blautia sp.]
MNRNVSLEEISDGRLYGLNDMVKADCQDCVNCSECCHGMGDTILLDPYDMYRLCSGLGCIPQDRIGKELEVGAQDGLIEIHLAMKGETDACSFLDSRGRCSIHPYRPGFCRLFPLGRVYQEGEFRYFLQIHECVNKNRTKIKVKKWIDTPNALQYDRYICDWHYFLLDAQEVMRRSGDGELIKNLNLYILNRFFLKPYAAETDFYPQFYQRLEEARGLLALE